VINLLPHGHLSEPHPWIQKAGHEEAYDMWIGDRHWERRLGTEISSKQVISRIARIVWWNTLLFFFSKTLGSIIVGKPIGRRTPYDTVRNALIMKPLIGIPFRGRYTLASSLVPAAIGIHLLRIMGEIDCRSLPRFRREISEEVRPHNRYILDLSRFKYGSSTGPCPLLELLHMCDEREALIAVVNMDPRIELGLGSRANPDPRRQSMSEAIQYVEGLALKKMHGQ
jgi:anti-anti-sigma factor